jgi:hypothetical protein
MYEGILRFRQDMEMGDILDLAPSGEAVTAYDLQQIALYAALIDAADTMIVWEDAAADLMQIDPQGAGAEACWRSHLDRARWIVGPGLAQAVTKFGRADA